MPSLPPSPLAVLAAALLASCGPAATPAPASGPPVSNAAPHQGPACPTPTHAIAMGGSTADADAGTATAPTPLRSSSDDDDDDCVRGEVMTVLDAPAAAPHCHLLHWASPRSLFEQIVLSDLGTVVVEHGGCAHWWLNIRARHTGDRASPAVLRAGATLMRRLPANADHREHFADIADHLEHAAAGPPLEPGYPVAVTDSFEHVSVELDGDQLVVLIEIAL